MAIAVYVNLILLRKKPLYLAFGLIQRLYLLFLLSVNQFDNLLLRCLRVRLAAAVLHHVADKGFDCLCLAVFEVLHRLGIAGNRVFAQLQQRVVVQTAHVALADKVGGGLAGVEHFFQRGLGEIVADFAAVEQLDQLVELRRCGRHGKDLLVCLGLNAAENLSDNKVGDRFGRFDALNRLVKIFADIAVLCQQRRVLFGNAVVVGVALELFVRQLGHFGAQPLHPSRGTLIVTKSGSRK